ncbi:MAG: hypothetical protein HQ478_02320 [Chloroflexi bacterium]|nr:hypothetical protein [Chloroflexota bacterium]
MRLLTVGMGPAVKPGDQVHDRPVLWRCHNWQIVCRKVGEIELMVEAVDSVVVHQQLVPIAKSSIKAGLTDVAHREAAIPLMKLVDQDAIRH